MPTNIKRIPIEKITKTTEKNVNRNGPKTQYLPVALIPIQIK